MILLRLLFPSLLLAVVLAAGAGAARKGSVAINFSGGTLAPGDSLALEGQPVDRQGNPLPGAVTWKSSRTAVATVDGTGLLMAVAPGVTTITGSSGKLKGTILVQVTNPPTPDAVWTAVHRRAQINHVLECDGVLYWTEADGKTTAVGSMPAGGGGITDRVREPGKDNRGVRVAYAHLAALDDILFYTRNISGVASHTSVRRMPKLGGAHSLVLPEDAASEPFRPSRWGPGGGFLFATFREPAEVGLPAATELGAYDPTTAEWARRISGEFNAGKLALLAVTPDWVYARGQDGNRTKIIRLPTTGENNDFEVILDQDGPDSALDEAGATDGANLYFWSRRGGDHKLQSIPIAGGDVTTLQTGNFGSGLAHSGGELFWVREDTRTAGTLLRLPVGGGTPATVRSGIQSLPALGGVAVGGGFAWVVEKVSKAEQRILRLPL